MSDRLSAYHAGLTIAATENARKANDGRRKVQGLKIQEWTRSSATAEGLRELLDYVTLEILSATQQRIPFYGHSTGHLQLRTGRFCWCQSANSTSVR